MSESKNISTRPSLSKKQVDRALAETMAPILSEHGFQPLKAGFARRYSEQRIDVIQVDHFNRSSHFKWGTTPYSFALPIGFFLTFAPSFCSPDVPRDAQENLAPDATICHVRGTPKKGIRQSECKIPNIWYVDPEGKSLDDVLNDVRDVLVRDVIPWFTRFHDLHALLSMFRDDPDEMSTKNNCWGWGRMNSPVRLALTGLVAFELEQFDLAEKCLRGVLEKGGLAALAGTKEIVELFEQKLQIASTKSQLGSR